MTFKYNALNTRKLFWHFRHGGAQAARGYLRRNPFRVPTSVQSSAGLSGALGEPPADIASRPVVREAKRGPDTSGAANLACEELSYSNRYSRGFFIAEGCNKPESIRNWQTRRFGRFEASNDEMLPTEILETSGDKGNRGVLIFGEPNSSALGTSDSSKISEYLLSKIPEHSETWADFDSSVAWLGGRYVIVARAEEAYRVHVDATASRSCYWQSSSEGLFLASHAKLISDVSKSSSSEVSQWVLTNPKYRSSAGKWLPGTVTPYDGVKLIYPNCVLGVCGTEVRHSRFFPFEQIEPRSVAMASRVFLKELKFQIGTILESSGRPVLALTSGGDSRMILLSNYDRLMKSGVIAFTYHMFQRNADSGIADLLGANSLAVSLGIPHLIADVKPHVPRTKFARLYYLTFKGWARFPTLAKTVYETLSSSDNLIMGIGGEVGTAFYRDRYDSLVTPEILAAKFTQSAFNQDPRLKEIYKEYISYTELPLGPKFGLDPFDLFYWENRLANWAAYGYSELELGPTVALPFNSRTLLVAMLSVSFKDRVRKSIYKVIEREVLN